MLGKRERERKEVYRKRRGEYVPVFSRRTQNDIEILYYKESDA